MKNEEWAVYGSTVDSAGNRMQILPDPLPDQQVLEQLRRKLVGDE